MVTNTLRDRIAVILMQPGQPMADGLVLSYLRALLAAARPGLPALPLRPLLALRAHRLARHFVLDDLTAALEDLVHSDLENALWGDGIVQVFTAGLFAAPSPIAVAHEVAAFRPDRVVVVPPSPLFSGGLNGAALQVWDRAARAAGLDIATSSLCCHPTDAAVLRGLVQRARAALMPGGTGSLLLVAPGTGWAGGDPFGWQMARLTGELARLLDLPVARIATARLDIPGFDDGGLPTVEQVIRRCRAPSLAVLPLSPWPLVRAQWGHFEEEWRELAGAAGILSFTLTRPALTEGAELAPLVRQALAGRSGVCTGFGRRLCPADQGHCPHRRIAVAAMRGATVA